VKSGVQVSPKNRNIEVGCYFNIDLGGVAHQKVSGGILYSPLQLPQHTAVVV